MTRLRAAVIGVGYLGRFHLEKFNSLDDVELIAVVDTDEERLESIASEFKIEGITDYKTLLDQIDIVSIVTPPEHHHSIARDCLNAGIHTLVEKPITETVDEAKQLIQIANAKQLVFQVGHLERFNPAILALGEELHDPLFFESHRLSPFKLRGTEVNVILDLMIHDIDLILSVVKSEIKDVRASGFSVLSDSVDIANARLEFENGCVANITASRVSPQPMRKMRIFQPDGYISIDFSALEISMARKTEENAQDQSGITTSQRNFNKIDALFEEISAFVNSVKKATPAVVTGEDGLRALELAIEITEKIQNS